MKYLNTITNGDCYELIKELPDKSVDLIMTDPPYLIGQGGTSGIFKDDSKKGQLYLKQIVDLGIANGIDNSILDEYVRVLKKINIYIWCNKDQILNYMNYFVTLKKCNFEFIIWAKNDPTPFTCGHYLKDKEYCLLFWETGAKLKGNFDTMRTVYFSNKNKKDKEKFSHPTIKPVEIIKNLIRNSTDENDIVLDTFMGSGTTAVACKETGRQFIGFEIEKKWCDIANDRINGIDATGQTSFLLR